MPWDSWEALHTIARTLPRVAVFTVAAFSAIYLSERLTGAPTVQYRTRGFRHDLVYWFYYLSGVHNLVFTSALFAALTPRLAVFDLKLLEGMHPIPRYVCYWVVVDFLAYWFHRWKHSSRFLWAFHAVHHSQEQLTAPTLVRGHPLEQFIGQVLFFAPLLALGAPPAAWLPIAFLRTFLESSQHSALRWRFGPFYWIIVSPKFHSFHHSTRPEHHNRNFGLNLSVWDFLFGTWVDEKERPADYGLTDIKLPTLWSQILCPFRMLLQSQSDENRSFRPGVHGEHPSEGPEKYSDGATGGGGFQRPEKAGRGSVRNPG